MWRSAYLVASVAARAALERAICVRSRACPRRDRTPGRRVDRLLPVRERVLGAEHPDTLTARASIGRWTGEARDQYAALLPVREQVCGA